MTEQKRQAILDKVVQAVQGRRVQRAADRRHVGGNVRYARNSVSTSGIVEDTDLAVQVELRQARRHRDDQRVRRRLAGESRAPRRGARAARAGKSRVHAADREAGLRADAAYRRRPRRRHAGIPRAALPALHRASRKDKIVAAGFFTTAPRFSAMATRRAIRLPEIDQRRLHLTVRTDDGRGSGWVGADAATWPGSTAPTPLKIAASRRPRARPTPRRSSRASTP